MASEDLATGSPLGLPVGRNFEAVIDTQVRCTRELQGGEGVLMRGVLARARLQHSTCASDE